MAIKSVVFDLDGVLWTGEKRMDGALDTVDNLRELGYQVLFLTNNSSKGRQEVIQKLNRLGFEADEKAVYCSSYAAASFLVEKEIKSAYVIGSDSLCNELVSRGIKVKHSSDVSAVVVGLDLNFSYEKIATALRAIVMVGAQLIVANTDRWYYPEIGRILPGCGAMAGAIIGATGYKADFIVGKPNTYMLELLCREHGLTSEEICVVGDMPEVDIQMAVNFRCLGILFNPEDLYRTFPGVKVKKLSEIIPLLEERKRRVRI